MKASTHRSQSGVLLIIAAPVTGVQDKRAERDHRPGVVVSVAFDGEAREARLLTAEEQQAIVERAVAVDKT